MKPEYALEGRVTCSLPTRDKMRRTRFSYRYPDEGDGGVQAAFIGSCARIVGLV